MVSASCQPTHCSELGYDYVAQANLELRILNAGNTGRCHHAWLHLFSEKAPNVEDSVAPGLALFSPMCLSTSTER